jgi:hypothetical protein
MVQHVAWLPALCKAHRVSIKRFYAAVRHTYQLTYLRSSSVITLGWITFSFLNNFSDIRAALGLLETADQAPTKGVFIIKT